MCRFNFPQLWDYLRTSLVRLGASRVEHAARGRVKGARHFTCEKYSFALCVQYRVRYWHGRQQGFGVWMDRVSVNLVPFSQFHHMPQIHDANAVADVTDH